jgi:hypothetical protein
MSRVGYIVALSVLGLLTFVPPSGGKAATGADTTAAAAVSSEQQVRSRAEARWQALSKGDLHRAYEFTTPAYRKVTPFSSFRAQFGQAVTWHGAKVEKVKIAPGGGAAEVLLVLSYTAVLPSGDKYEGHRGMREKWLLADGQWWFAGD